jgi:hypothetical protein
MLSSELRKDTNLTQELTPFPPFVLEKHTEKHAEKRAEKKPDSL